MTKIPFVISTASCTALLALFLMGCGGESTSTTPDGGSSDSNTCATDTDCLDWAGLAACERGVCLDAQCAASPITGEACDDGDQCTTDSVCDDGACVDGVALVCNDDNECTDDGCHPDAGCVHGPNTLPCDDGNACTAEAACDSGACIPGPPVSCDDANECTTDGCDSATGCTYELTQFFLGGAFRHEGPCEDGNPCTLSGICNEGLCNASSTIECDDGNACTNDDCEDGVGCVATNNADPCDDDSVCTTNDACKEGACAGGGALSCDDFDSCTDDTCDPISGCAHALNTAPCNDNNACTTGDTCDAGDCIGGDPPTCDDQNACTDDFCDVSLGCVATNNQVPCEDDSLCTTDSTCSGGSCGSGTPVVCDDGDGCTQDDCLPAIGCVLVGDAPDFAPCDDGASDTLHDLCVDGGCVGGISHVVYGAASDDCGDQQRESVAFQSVGDDLFALFNFTSHAPSCEPINYTSSWQSSGANVPVWHGQDLGAARAADHRVVVGDAGFLAVNMGWSVIFNSDLKDAVQALAPNDVLNYRDVSHGIVGGPDDDHYVIVGRNLTQGTGFAAHCALNNSSGLWDCQTPTPSLSAAKYHFSSVEMLASLPDACTGLDICPDPSVLHGVWLASNASDGTAHVLFGDSEGTYSTVWSLPATDSEVTQSFQRADQSVWFLGTEGLLMHCTHLPTPECTVLTDAISGQGNLDFAAGWEHQGSPILLAHDESAGPVLVALVAGMDPALPASWTLRPFDAGGLSDDVVTDGATLQDGGLVLSMHRTTSPEASLLVYPASPAP